MNLGLASAFAVFAVKATDPAAPGSAPDGPPTDVSSQVYTSPEKIRITWANGDPNAYTRIYMEQGTCPGTPPLVDTVNPGLTSFNSAFLRSADPHRVQLTHWKNGQESAKTTCHETTELT